MCISIQQKSFHLPNLEICAECQILLLLLDWDSVYKYEHQLRNAQRILREISLEEE